MTENFPRRVLYFWTLFIGLGAVCGAMMMFIDPTGVTFGMDGFIPAFQVLPFADVVFQNLIFPGISLLIVNGLTQLVTFVLLLRRVRCASACALACGLLLMAWITIQFVIFPFNFLSTAYFIFGLLEAATALWLRRKERPR